MTRPDPQHLLSGAAAVLRGWPEVRARLGAVHVPGPDGRCAGCTSQVRVAPQWPCTLAGLAADRARPQ